MAKLTKKQKTLQGRIDSNRLYPVAEALALVKDCATAKFDESIDVAVQLGVDAKKSDQVVRGAVVLPNGTGKTKRVAVFAQGAKADEAKAAGADVVGMDDLAAQVKGGNMPFDVVIAAPDAMRVVGTLGQILGPRGLMPNPKVGTVTPDVATAVKNAKAGQVQFRVDKAGIVHGTIGRRSFDADKLQGNLAALIEALNKAKPASSKGVYLRKVAVSSTMGFSAEPVSSAALSTTLGIAQLGSVETRSSIESTLGPLLGSFRFFSISSSNKPPSLPFTGMAVGIFNLPAASSIAALISAFLA